MLVELTYNKATSPMALTNNWQGLQYKARLFVMICKNKTKSKVLIFLFVFKYFYKTKYAENYFCFNIQLTQVYIKV